MQALSIQGQATKSARPIAETCLARLACLLVLLVFTAGYTGVATALNLTDPTNATIGAGTAGGSSGDDNNSTIIIAGVVCGVALILVSITVAFIAAKHVKSGGGMAVKSVKVSSSDTVPLRETRTIGKANCVQKAW